jgi:DNA-binding MarR family transcriptional regulator
VAELVPKDGLNAWKAFVRAHAAAISRIEVELEAAGMVPLAWYDVLVAISSAPGRRLRMRDLASELVLTRSGATRLADRLEVAGLLKRERTDEDRRGAFAVLTAAGRRALRTAWPVYARGINQFFVDVLTADEARLVADALARVEGASRPSG